MSSSAPSPLIVVTFLLCICFQIISWLLCVVFFLNKRKTVNIQIRARSTFQCQRNGIKEIQTTTTKCWEHVSTQQQQIMKAYDHRSILLQCYVMIFFCLSIWHCDLHTKCAECFLNWPIEIVAVELCQNYLYGFLWRVMAWDFIWKMGFFCVKCENFPWLSHWNILFRQFSADFGHQFSSDYWIIFVNCWVNSLSFFLSFFSSLFLSLSISRSHLNTPWKNAVPKAPKSNANFKWQQLALLVAYTRFHGIHKFGNTHSTANAATNY